MLVHKKKNKGKQGLKERLLSQVRFETWLYLVCDSNNVKRSFISDNVFVMCNVTKKETCCLVRGAHFTQKMIGIIVQKVVPQGAGGLSAEAD